MTRLIAMVALLVGLCLWSFNCVAAPIMGEGEIDDDLRFEGFQIGDDGYIKGFIINESDAVRRNVALDMYTTNPQETRIYWRKSIQLGDVAPKQKRQVREAYDGPIDPGSKIKVMFKIPHKSNFRN